MEGKAEEESMVAKAIDMGGNGGIIGDREEGARDGAVVVARVGASKSTVRKSQERGIENGELGMGRREQ